MWNDYRPPITSFGRLRHTFMIGIYFREEKRRLVSQKLMCCRNRSHRVRSAKQGVALQIHKLGCFPFCVSALISTAPEHTLELSIELAAMDRYLYARIVNVYVHNAKRSKFPSRTQIIGQTRHMLRESSFDVTSKMMLNICFRCR